MAKKDDQTTKLTPKLRFPEFNEPWHLATIGDFFISKDVHEKAAAFESDKILTVKLHTNGVVRNERTGTLTGGANYLKRRTGQFIFSKIDLLNGAFGIVPPELDGFYSSSDVPAFSFRENYSASFFISWLTANYQRLVIERTGTSATLKRVAPEKFKALPILLPTLAEQRKIAACLTSLDKWIAAEGRKLETLRAHKKGLMQQLFPQEGESRPRLRFPEFRDAGEWERRILGTLTRKVGSGITPQGGDKNYVTSGRPFIRSQNVGWGAFILDDVAYIDEDTHRTFDATELAISDVLLNITGASIGRSAVADSRVVGGNVNQHVCIIRTKPDELNPLLLNQYLISDGGQSQIDSFQAGGNRQGLNFGQIRSFEIPLPPTEAEQQRIAACLTSLDAQLDAVSRKVDSLRVHKKGLMQRLFPSPEGA